MKYIVLLFLIAIIASAQIVEVPTEWLSIQDHSGTTTRITAVSSDPCYTDLISNYKPIIKKLDNGKWEIVFVSEIAENLP